MVVAQVGEPERWANGISEAAEFDYRSFSKPEAIAAQQRWMLIESENADSTDNEWAGDYAIGDVGDVSMVILRWTPNSGFVFLSVYNCWPTIIGLNYGGVEFSPNVLRLFPEVSTPKRIHHGHRQHSRSRLSKTYLPVKWGDCHYLIPEDRLSIFYDYVAGMGVYRPGNYGFLRDEGFLLKRDDHAKRVFGMPIVPPGYEHLVKKPITGTVSSVGRTYLRRVRDAENPWWNQLITEVTLSIGKAEGVTPGMTFRILDLEEDEIVEVRRVSRHSSQAIIVRSVRKRPGEKFNEWDDGTDPDDPVIIVGWRLATSPLKL
jgi:hypothetical protein